MAEKSVKAWAIYMRVDIIFNSIRDTKKQRIADYLSRRPGVSWPQVESWGYTCRRVVVEEA